MPLTVLPRPDPTHLQPVQQEIHKGTRTLVRVLEAQVEHQELGELGAVGVEDGAFKDGQQGVPCMLGAPWLLVAAPENTHKRSGVEHGALKQRWSAGQQRRAGLAVHKHTGHGCFGVQ